MFLLKKLPCIYNTNLVSYKQKKIDSEEQSHVFSKQTRGCFQKKKRSGFVNNLRSLSGTNKLEASKIDGSDFLFKLSTLYNSQESVPAGVICFDEYLSNIVSDSFTIKMPGEFDDYLYEECSNKVELYFKDLSLRDKVLKVLILFGYDVFGRDNQCLAKQYELEGIFKSTSMNISDILNLGGLGVSCPPGVFQSGLFKEPQLLQSQFFIAKDNFDMIMQVST